MFKKDADGELRFIGNSFREHLHLSTWATDLKPKLDAKGKATGRLVAVLRDNFKGLFVWIKDAGVYACTVMAEVQPMPERDLNKMLRPFSHAVETSQLIDGDGSAGEYEHLSYSPDKKGLTITARGGVRSTSMSGARSKRSPAIRRHSWSSWNT